MTRLTRRAFLLLASLLVPAARLRAQPAITVDDFVRLSQRLTGRTRLDRQVAATYLNALAAVPANVSLLAELRRTTGPGPTPAHVALERTIIEWWYTGIYTADGSPRVATHTGALVWGALGMPAPGTCAGPFGVWSRPPQRTA